MGERSNFRNYSHAPHRPKVAKGAAISADGTMSAHSVFSLLYLQAWRAARRRSAKVAMLLALFKRVLASRTVRPPFSSVAFFSHRQADRNPQGAAGPPLGVSRCLSKRSLSLIYGLRPGLCYNSRALAVCRERTEARVERRLEKARRRRRGSIASRRAP